MSVIVFTLIFVVLSPLIGLKKRYVLTSEYISILLKVLKFICRIDWEVKGDILSEKPVTIASNHQGLWESFYIQTPANPLTTIIKKEVIYVPFSGWALNLLNPIKINRSKKIQSAKRVIASGSQKLQDGFSILLFPEGTRKIPGKRVGKFARSAAD
jgi:1-acyl-sn-glycerol-3-phosphate acyltransferase